MSMFAKRRFHVARIHCLILAFSSLPAAVTFWTDRLTSFEVGVAGTTLMVERALVARVFNAALVLSFTA